MKIQIHCGARVAISSASRLAISALILLAGLGDAAAQKATEQYIPIGESPGVSGEQSYIGTIVSLDSESRTLTIDAGGEGERTVRLTSASRIWLDRSAGGRTNVEGSFANCEVGRRVEVMYAPGDPETAVWIKIEIP